MDSAPASRRSYQFVSSAVEVRYVGWQRRVGWMLTALSLGSLVAAFALVEPITAPFAALSGVLGMLVSSILLATAARDPGSSVGMPADLEVRDGLLIIRPHRGSPATSISLRRVSGGWLEAVHGDALAVVQTTSGTIVTAAFRGSQGDAAAEVEALLRAVGAEQKATAIQVARASTGTRGCAAGCLYAVALIGLPVAATFFMALLDAVLGDNHAVEPLAVSGLFTSAAAVLVWYMARILPTATLTIGHDAIRLQRTWRRSRYFTFEDLERVSCHGNQLLLHARAGLFRLDCQSTAAARAVADRIDAVRKEREETACGFDLALLERAGRSAEAWRRHLGSLLHRDAHYRLQALDRDRLLSIVADPRLAPERRVGAALALAGDADRRGCDLLRMAAEASAHPKLRLALARAADGELDLESLEEATRAHAGR